MPRYKIQITTKPNDVDYNELHSEEFFDNYKDAKKAALESFSSIVVHGRHYSEIKIKILQETKQEFYTPSIKTPLLFEHKQDAEIAAKVLTDCIEGLFGHDISSDDFIEIKKEKSSEFNRICSTLTYT